ncbi:TIR domain-containing protein [Fictibacillus nanhaiensis]|uniref:TIR domain-containing protein n=1 Tax=Fictibacillus nanhaiensis TaxID=742169 RepID=A0ABS2ZRK6_9BACL|nr:TIR domain-containing protein [Fictibacillus nanhaiensis]
MAQTVTTKSKVFISYSWTSIKHEDWVLELAQRLMSDGVEVVFDKWDLKEGQDIYVFMESMVTSPEIDKVLIICDSGYKAKANERAGGVGTETQIISSQVYHDVGQEKFIPIVAERNEEGQHYIPTYIETRKYIDLSNDEMMAQNYESLLRNLYNRPQYRKPQVGKPPSFLFEDEAISTFKLQSILNQIKSNFLRNERIDVSLMEDFRQELLGLLPEFKIQSVPDPANIDDLILAKIDDMTIVRNTYVEFIEVISTITDSDYLIDLFEDLYNKYTEIKRSENQYYDTQFDHFRFFLREVFLYTVMIFLSKSSFETLGEFLKARFFIRDAHKEDLENNTFVMFDCYLRSLDEIRNNKLPQKYLSVTADMLVKRANLKYSKEDIVEADYLLYYISEINKTDSYQNQWFPRTYVYGTYQKSKLLQKLISRRHFEKVKYLFGAQTISRLKEIFNTLENPYSRGYGSFNLVYDIKSHINPEDIGKYE